MDLHQRPYRSNRPSHFPSLNHHHIPHTTPDRHTSPALSSSYPLVYSPSENSYQNTPSMSADIQQEYPFDLSFTKSLSMSLAELDLPQSDFLNPCQLPWTESKSKFKLESSPASQQVFDADAGSYAFYNDSNGNPAIDTRLFTSKLQPQQPSEMLTSAPQQVVYFSPAAENEMEMEGDLDLRAPSPPAFGAPVPFPRAPGSSSPPGLTRELDEDLGSESGDSEAANSLDGDDDGDSGGVRAPRSSRLSPPVPVPNLTKSRGRRMPTAPVIIVQGGVQKNMRMHRCTVEGCYKCFARGKHLKRHVRSIRQREA